MSKMSEWFGRRPAVKQEAPVTVQETPAAVAQEKPVTEQEKRLADLLARTEFDVLEQFDNAIKMNFPGTPAYQNAAQALEAFTKYKASFKKG